MASTAGGEIMNSEVAGSILTVLPVKRKKVFAHVQEPVTPNHLKTTIRAIRSLTVTPIPKIALNTGYLLGVLDIIWEISG